VCSSDLESNFERLVIRSITIIYQGATVFTVFYLQTHIERRQLRNFSLDNFFRHTQIQKRSYIQTDIFYRSFVRKSVNYIPFFMEIVYGIRMIVFFFKIKITRWIKSISKVFIRL